MAKTGPERTVSDERILLEFLLNPGPAFFTSEITENLPLVRQQVNNILDELEQDGYVTSKHASGRRLWWLTPKGNKWITERAREKFQDDF